MNKSLYTIAENSLIATKTFKMVLEGDGVVDGEFVDIGIPGYFLRRPLSVCDCEEGQLTLVYKVVGEGTRWWEKGRRCCRKCLWGVNWRF